MEEVRAAIGNRSDEQASSTPPFGSQAFGRGIAIGDQLLSAGDKVGEGILLLEELPIFIPLLSEVTPPTHLGLYIDKATIHEAQDRDAEVRIERDPIAPIAIKQGWSRSVPLQSLAIKQGHRYLHSIGSRSPQTLYGIIIGAEVSSDFLLLQKAALTVHHIIFVERGRTIRRRITIANGRRIISIIPLKADGIDGLGEVNGATGFPFCGEDTNLRQAVLSLL